MSAFYRLRGKRWLDLALTIPALILLAPLMGMVALLARWTHGLPVLFCQARIGQNQSPFTIIKFRTMRHRPSESIDQVSERAIEAGHDYRVTPVGRILRATSIDEVPQLINVLNGTMSLVGPRPIIPEQLRALPAGYGRRFSVRPGITGWAQVNGRRELDWLKQLDHDLWYVDHHSLGLDLRILLKTALVVLKGSGVYGDARSNWRSYMRVEDR